MSVPEGSSSANYTSTFLPPARTGRSDDAGPLSAMADFERDETEHQHSESEKPANGTRATDGRRAANGSKNPPTKSTRPERPPPPSTERHRFLSPAEWAIIAHGVGGLCDNDDHSVVHPTCWYWPPRGMPEGLYKDVVRHRAKFFWYYHLISTVRWVGMVLQLFIGATLTALGAMSTQQSIAITVLAAANTVQTGLLALLQNSGLPNRYRSDRDEFQEVEDHLKELLDTGLVGANESVDQALCGCFERFQAAKQTVHANIPASYTPSSVLQAAERTPEAPRAPAPPAVAAARTPKSREESSDETPLEHPRLAAARQRHRSR